MSPRRRPLVAGNWKLHNTIEESIALARTLVSEVGEAGHCDVVVAPVFTSLKSVAEAVRGSRIGVAAQDIHWEDKGAFTGAVGPTHVKDAGCQWVIVGHSERRQLFGETDEGVHRKVKAALARDLRPIVCVGETLEEREAGKTLAIVLGQVDAALQSLSASELAHVVVAYEPVWAIGTGRTAKASDAQEVHQHVRGRLATTFGAERADGVRILYGGSVKADNAASLLSQPDIDGALVGGASLDPKSFVAIVQAAQG